MRRMLPELTTQAKGEAMRKPTEVELSRFSDKAEAWALADASAVYAKIFVTGLDGTDGERDEVIRAYQAAWSAGITRAIASQTRTIRRPCDCPAYHEGEGDHQLTDVDDVGE